MNDFMWKLKQFLRQVLPFAIVGFLIYGAWTLHKQGAFRHGPKYAILTILHKIPYFGSRFSHYGGYASSSPSYAYSGGGHGGARHRGYHRRGRHRRRRHHR